MIVHVNMIIHLSAEKEENSDLPKELHTLPAL
jgi:hypothetical protein